MTVFLKWFKEFLIPTGMLASLIIGAGMFGLPYVFSFSGFWPGVLYLFIFAGVFTAIHRMYVRVIENVPGNHRFVGYARELLGKHGFFAGIIASLVGLIFVLTAYLVLAGFFMKIAFPSLGAEASMYIFWAFSAGAVLLSLKRLTIFEFAVSIAMIGIVIFLFAFGAGSAGELPNANMRYALFPYGVTLFAFSGRAGISSLWNYFSGNGLRRKKIYAAITAGTFAPAFVYLAFVLAVFWLSPGDISEDALSGLAIPANIHRLLGFLGVLTLWTSYFFLGLEARDIMRFDIKLPRSAALILVTFLPLVLYWMGLSGFIQLLGVAGGIFLALESIMVVFMYARVVKYRRFLEYLLIFIFAIGALYEVTTFL